MDISIIIPVFRDIDGLKITLESIRIRQWDPSRVEVIVCNDGGGDAVSALAAQFGCVEARLAENRGSYAARNAGVRIARSHTLAFIDADEIVTADWLTAGLAALEHADYVGGRVVVDAGANATFWERVDASFAFPVTTYLERRRFAPTANLFVRRTVFQHVGGFDEALTSGGDQEFGVRVAQSGLQQRYCEQAIVIHPARSFPEQLRKARRTSRGSARLQILMWRRSGIALAAKAAILAAAKLGHAAVLAAAFPFVRPKSLPRDTVLLAAGHALIGSYYHVAHGAFIFLAMFQRGRLQSRIPDVGDPSPQ